MNSTTNAESKTTPTEKTILVPATEIHRSENLVTVRVHGNVLVFRISEVTDPATLPTPEQPQVATGSQPDSNPARTIPNVLYYIPPVGSEFYVKFTCREVQPNHWIRCESQSGDIYEFMTDAAHPAPRFAANDALMYLISEAHKDHDTLRTYKRDYEGALYEVTIQRGGK